MKRTMSVMGHLGADPEIKTTKNGTAYTSFRLANSAYGDAEGQTSWFTVTVWEPSKQKLCSKLKKGSCIIVEGDYSDRLYVSTKTNKTEISRDIVATAIYFGSSRSEDGEQSQSNQSTATQPAAVTPKPTTTTPKPAATTNVVTPSEANGMPSSPIDDLPF